MTVARLQQWGVLAVLLPLGGWLLWCLPEAPGRALAGVALVWLAWAGLLALQFGLMLRANRGGGVPAVRPLQLLRAAWAEMALGWQVFGWRQPFRSRAMPDWLPVAPPGQRPPRGVVLVHGFLCNRGFWLPWLTVLRAHGHAYEAVNLEPVGASIDYYAATIEAAVQRVAQATGRPPVLLCHSMGGLAARAWLRRYQADARVHRVLTLGTPHGGTALAQSSRSLSGQQMALGSAWLAQLQRAESPARTALFTCWYSNCDNIVFPARTATLAGADNRFLAGVAHLQLAFQPQVLHSCLEALAD